MRKLFALVATVAMVLSMFSGIAFAAAGAGEATATITFKSGQPAAAGANSTLLVTLTAATPAVSLKWVKIDLSGTSFVVRGTGASSWNSVAGSVGTVSGNTIAFTNATGLTGTEVATFEIPVTNPTTDAAIAANAVVVSVSDVTAGTAPATLTTAVTSIAVDKYAVTLNPTSVIEKGTATVEATITENGVVASGTAINWTVKAADGSTVVAAGSTTSGTFSFRQTFENKANFLSSSYLVEVADASSHIGSKTLTVKYNAVVDDFGTISYNDTKTFTGKITDGASTPVGLQARVILARQGWTNTTLLTTDAVGWTSTGTDGSFVLSQKFTDAGKYDLVVWKDFASTGSVQSGETYTLKSFTVSSQSMIVTVAGDAVSTSGISSVLTFTAKVGDVNYTSTATFVVKDSAGNVVSGSAVDASKGIYTYNFTTAGVYTVEGTKTANSTDVYTGKASFTVMAPARVNVAVITPAGDGAPDSTPNNIKIRVTDASGNGVNSANTLASQIKAVKFTASGSPLAASKTFNSATTGVLTDPAGGTNYTDAAVSAKIQQAGTITIEGTVTMGDDSVVTFTKTITVKGYLATITKTLGTVGDVVTLTTTVTTADGTPVNNATVTYTLANGFQLKGSDGLWGSTLGSVAISPTTKNINNGIYSQEVKLMSAGDVTVNVAYSGTKAEWVATVDGQQVYTVTTTPGSLSVSKTEDLIINVKNADGANVTSLTALSVSGAGLSLNIGSSTLVDADKNGTVDSYKFVGVKPTSIADVTITASTENGTKAGKATIKAVAPAVTVTPNDNKLTENVKESMTVALGDTQNGVAMQGVLKVTAVGATLHGIYLNNQSSSEIIAANSYTFLAANTFNFKVTAYDVVEATTAVAPQLKLEVSYDGGTTWSQAALIDIVPLTITVSPEKLSVGSLNRVDITVKDAHGVAYADKDVELLGSEGTTDDNGSVTMFITLNSTGTAKVNVSTSRTNVYTVKKVPITYTVPTEAVKTVLQGSSVERKGENLFVQIAKFQELGATKSWNAATKTATFTCNGKIVEVTIGSTTAKVNGVNTTMPTAPYIANNLTMVPTRFISEALGWKVDWAAGDIVTITLP